jgi:hypothetical protein
MLVVKCTGECTGCMLVVSTSSTVSDFIYQLYSL